MIKRLVTLAAIGLSIALAGCNATAPKTADQAAAEPPLATAAQQPKSLIEMEFELRKAEIELQTTQTMAMIKFAAESNSPFAMGMVAGLYGGKAQAGLGGAPVAGTGGGGSFMQAVMQDRRHQSEIELRKAELAERGSLWNKGLQVFDRLIGYRQFSKGIDLQRHSMDLDAYQDTYRLDTYYRTQQAGYDFAGKVVDKGPYFFSLPAGSAAVSVGGGE